MMVLGVGFGSIAIQKFNEDEAVTIVRDYLIRCRVL